MDFQDQQTDGLTRAAMLHDLEVNHNYAIRQICRDGPGDL